MTMTELLTLDRVRADVAELLYQDPAEIADTADLVESGLDSIRIMTLVERWRTDAGVRISFVELAESPTVAAWWTLLSAHLRGQGHG
jgi:bifunctional isochorismate lyase/aryl carrier protein